MAYEYHAFLSHNRADKEWTRRLAGRLRAQGLSVFFDEDSIKLGEDILISIEMGLKSSRHVLLVLTPEALGSPWVALEYSASLYRDPGAAARSIIPILRRDCDIPLILSRLKYLDARSNDFDRQVRHLLNGIDMVEVTPSKSTAWLTSTAEMQRESERTCQALLSVGPPVLPEGSGLYVERTVDRVAERAIENGSMLVVSGSRRSGKTSLLLRAGRYATGRGRRVAYVDFELFGGGGSSPQTYFALCERLSGTLAIAPPDSDRFIRSPGPSLGEYLEDLPQDSALLLDEFDMLRSIGALEDFSMILRAAYSGLARRHREPVPILIGSILPPWRFIDTMIGSDFNIGIHEHLGGFALDEAERLIKGIMPSLDDQEIEQIQALVGGHPYLLQCAMRWLCLGNNVQSLLSQALFSDGPFGTFLATFPRAQSNLDRQYAAAGALVSLSIESRERLELAGAIHATPSGDKWTGELFRRAFIVGESEPTASSTP